MKTVKEKIEAARNEIRTNLKLEGSEKQIAYALNLVESTFGEDLMTLEMLRKDSEEMKDIPDFPIHVDLEKMEKEWDQVKDEKNAGKIIELLASY